MRAARIAKIRCELRAKIETNAIPIKYLCCDTYNNPFKVESKTISKGNMGDIIPPLVEALLANLALFRHIVRSLRNGIEMHPVLNHLMRPNRYLTCCWQYM